MNFDPETAPAATSQSAPPHEELAASFPAFELLECLGRGGMGIVYKARQKTLDRLVAIKILADGRHDDPAFADRFRAEAKTLARLAHPHIVTVHDFGEADGLFYLVMEFVDGVNLRDILRDGKMDPAQALAVVPPVCEALEYAHEKGVVHRDIKPENLLLDRDGRVKIADFGIASLAGAAGERSGTPPYMAPEQAGGNTDRTADIYALGVVLYEMLTGERPGSGAVAPSGVVPIDARIDEIVLRALDRDPARRYQTAGEFRTVVQTMDARPSPIPTGEWQIRCTSCDRARPLADVGGIRIGAASAGKRTLAWCRNCGFFRVAAIERAGFARPGPLRHRLVLWPTAILYVLRTVALAGALYSPHAIIPAITLLIVSGFAWVILFHRCWSAVPPADRPRSAAWLSGLLLLPGANLVAIFLAFYGLDRSYARVRSSSPELPLVSALGRMTAFAVVHAALGAVFWISIFGYFGPFAADVSLQATIGVMFLTLLLVPIDFLLFLAAFTGAVHNANVVGGIPDRTIPSGSWVLDGGIEYRSSASTFGFPFLHIATGRDPASGRPRVARGVIALGGIAHVVVAIGTVAVGLVSCGLVSIGGIVVGGLAFGWVVEAIVALGSVRAGGVVAFGPASSGLPSLPREWTEAVHQVATAPATVFWLIAVFFCLCVRLAVGEVARRELAGRRWWTVVLASALVTFVFAILTINVLAIVAIYTAP